MGSGSGSRGAGGHGGGRGGSGGGGRLRSRGLGGRGRLGGRGGRRRGLGARRGRRADERQRGRRGGHAAHGQGPLQEIVDLVDVRLGLAIHGTVPRPGSRGHGGTGVVSHQGPVQGALVLRQEAVQEKDPGPDVELGVEDVGLAHQVAEGGGEELHQAAGVGQADGLRVAPGFGGDHGQDQLHAEQRIDLPLAAQDLQLGLHHRLPAVDAGAEGPGPSGPGDGHRVLAQGPQGRAGGGRGAAPRRGRWPEGGRAPVTVAALSRWPARLRHRPHRPPRSATGPAISDCSAGASSGGRLSGSGAGFRTARHVGEHQVKRWARREHLALTAGEPARSAGAGRRRTRACPASRSRSRNTSP